MHGEGDWISPPFIKKSIFDSNYLVGRLKISHSSLISLKLRINITTDKPKHNKNKISNNGGGILFLNIERMGIARLDIPSRM
jgi:hypothetical protein